MKDNDIWEILQKNNKRNKRIIEDLMKRRVKETPKNKFNLQEIYFYSQYYHISMNELLLNVLIVDYNDYIKFIHKKIKYIKSEEYNRKKQKYLHSKIIILKYRINWNKRNYFTKTKLVKVAESYNINTYDFARNILRKSAGSTRRVLNDSEDRKRLFIGKYINAELPKRYFEVNIHEIIRIVKVALKVAFHRRNIKLSSEEFKEEEQKCLLYMRLHGNSLKKDNTPMIVSDKFKKKQGKILYTKAFYYVLNEITKIKFETEYNDAIRYNSQVDNHDEFELLESLQLNKDEKIVAKLLIEGYKSEDII